MVRTIVHVLTTLPGSLRCVLLLCLLAFPAGCRASAVRYEPAPIASLGVWVVDWDQKRGLEELAESPKLFDRVNVFAAYFDPEGEIFLDPKWATALSEPTAAIRAAGVPLYLTVVNDRIGKGVDKAKDPALINAMLADPVRRDAHIARLVAMARQYGFSGVDIDYEKVLESDWPAFLLFVADLRDALGAHGIALSVVLEPKSKYLQRPLPDGVEYTIMGYNLFGYHSGPGPKATPEFLAGLAARLKALGVLERTSLALATGGFDWQGGKVTKALTESDAQRLLHTAGVSPERDVTSGYQTATYSDGEGRKHEVWYADAATFATLWTAAHDAGFRKLHIWRLGGNDRMLFKTMQKGKI